MGKRAKLGATTVASFGLAAGLWTGLQFVVGADLGTASAAGVGLFAGLVTLGGVWLDSSSDINGAYWLDSTLTAVTGTFADRKDEWAYVKALVRRSRDREGIHLTLVIHGIPGIGKSEFALHAAHKLTKKLRRYARRRKLPLVARLVELKAHSGQSQRDLRDEFSALLREELGPDLPGTMNLDNLAAQWRKYLHGKLLILLLDDPADEDQVRRFLPGGSSCVILVTSRRELRGLFAEGAKQRRLGSLDEKGAAEMVEKILARSLSPEDRKAADGLAQFCGGQPLALKLAVKSLAGRNGVSLPGRVNQLERHSSRVLAIDEYAPKRDGASESVERSFDYSYAQLSDKSRLMLRRIAVAPVSTLGVSAAAALTGCSRDEAAFSLRELADESLAEEGEDEARLGYKMHDLIRDYGRNLADSHDPAESRAAVGRLLAYYWDAAAQADSLLTRQTKPDAVERPVPPLREDFSSDSTAISWNQAELSNLLACADYVANEAKGSDERDDHVWVVLFASALAGILRADCQWRRSIDLQTAAIASAEKILEPLGAANALSERGELYRLTNELDLAVTDLERAIAVYREVGGAPGRIGEAYALITYGVVLDRDNQADESRRTLSRALEIFRQADDPLGEANVLQPQGMTEFFAGDPETAARLLGQALALYQSSGQLLGMAHAHSDLARAQQRIGDDRSARENLELAAERYRELGNRLGEINVSIRLGVLLRQHDRDGAVRKLTEAIARSIEFDSHTTRVHAMDELAEVYRAHGDSKAAVDTWSQALQHAGERGMEREAAMLTGKLQAVGPSSASSRSRWIGFRSRWKR